MKRFWTSLATFSLVETIGRHPAMAAGILTLLGVGGGAGVAMLTTPTITPIPAAYFNQNQTGTTNNGLKTPNSGSGAMLLPSDSAGATPSFGVYVEITNDSALGYNNAEGPFPGLALVGNSTPGQPSFFFQRVVGGQSGTQWLNAPGPASVGSTATGGGGGSNYNTGLYTFTASGGGCAREPSGVWLPNVSVQVSDPGFMCSTTPTAAPTTIPNAGAQQTGVTATCAASGVSGQMLVTTNLSISPGLTPGQQYNLSGFTTSGGSGWTSGATITLTTVSVTGGGPYTLVGTLAGTCPTISSTGAALGGTSSATIAMPAISTTAPFSAGQTGITTKNGEHICAILGEDGDDSPFPGGAFLHMVDDQGNALPGAPALVPWLNQGTANWTGYVTPGTQSPSSPALTVTAMNSYSLTGAVFTGGSNSTVTFTVSTNPGFIAGSEFTVSGVSPSGYNQTYVALSQTGSGPYTIAANPLSGPAGTLQSISNPGAYSSGGSLVSVILPGMQVLGVTPTNGGAVISPYGTYGATGTGGVGTYALTVNPTVGATFTVSAVNTGTPSITVTGTPNPELVVGTTFTLNSNTYTITNIGSATGGGGTYTVNTGSGLATGTARTTGAVGSSGTPVTLFDFSGFYDAAAASTNPAGGVVTGRTPAAIGDFLSVFGAYMATAPDGIAKNGWGGTIGNVAMLYGVFPQSSGAPSTASLASLCKKTTDIQSFASANGMTVHSLYRLNDIGMYGDSGAADFIGSISGTALTVASTRFGSTSSLAANTVISGSGITGCPSTCPHVVSGSGTSYTLNTSGGTVSSEPMKAGTYQPLIPLQSTTVGGYIDNAGSQPTLHVTSLPITPTGAAATFTGSLGTQFTASISANTLTITNPLPSGTSNAVAAVGMTVVVPGGTNAVITSQNTNTDASGAYGRDGTYTINGSGQTVASETMFGTNSSGSLPGPPTTLFNVSVSTGTLEAGMYVTDGGVNLTAQPLLITAGSGSTFNVAGSYYPSFINDTTMVGSLSSLVPGSYIQNSSITTPVKVLSYQGACGISGAVNGGLGCYTLSNGTNGSIGSSGSPATFAGTSISDGGAIAPGPALTIKDQGPGIIFPVTTSSPISCSAFGSCAGTGALYLSGTYDTSVLGGAPSTIQAQVSLSAGGAAVPGCSACAWTNLASYSASLSSGTVFKWSGQALGIPAGGPYFVSVRAANGTAYATLPNSVKVGLPFDGYGQGQYGAFSTAQSGVNWSYFSGLWGMVLRHSPYSGNETYLQGPPITASFVPGQSTSIAGDRFGISGVGIPLSEGVGYFEQLLTNAFGWSASYTEMSHDGVGQGLMTLGSVTQTQTVGVGNGSATVWCSASQFCSEPSGGVQQPLTYSAAAQTGAQMPGSIAGTTLTVGTPMTSGALMPGMVLSLANGTALSGSPTLVNCTSGCGSSTTIVGASSVWTITNPNSVAESSGTALRADYPQTGGTPWPTFNVQLNGTMPFTLGGFGAELIKPGTFTVSVNGTVVCQDSQTFAYNLTGGNCTGAGVSGWVNYQTHDYEITFSSAPAGPIVASWTNVISPEAVAGQYNRPQNIDYFGDASGPQSGSIASLMSKTPGGLAGHIYSGCSTDEGYILQSASPSNQGYQFGAPGYATSTSWLYDAKFPKMFPGFSASTPFITFGQFRDEGPVFFNSSNNYGKLNICDQLFQDLATKSTFTGSISGGVMTLSANAVGPMWEGEVIGSASLPSPSGIYIENLCTVATCGGSASPQGWGVSGSTYAISNPSSLSASGAVLYNDVFYKGSGPAIYAGAAYDIMVQNQGLSGTVGNNPHMWLTGGRDVGQRMAAAIWGGLTNTGGAVFPPNASPPSLSRANDSASGTPSPAFDYTNTYAAVATPTSVSGGVLTFNGLSAHSRPIVPGQVVTCSGCSGTLYVTSVSNPPTQSTVAGAGQIGSANNGFTVSLGGGGTLPGGTPAYTFGCTPGSGGSNCINFDFSINTTNGTFGTAAALATCGANNLNGNAPNYAAPNGLCQDNGIGEITRGFRIGAGQAMYGGPTFPTGSVFDDGVDFWGGGFNRSAAFTCNIVAAKTAQCVHAPAYTSGAPSGIGKWSSGSTFANYGDMTLVSGRIASVLGYVGAQSFPIANAGSGYANGFYQSVTATCPTMGGTGNHAPYFDITVSGGLIVNVYPSAISTSSATQATGLGIGSACTLTDSNFPTGMKNGGAGSGGSINIPLAPPEGVGGVATYNTDSNTTGMFLFDNTGFPGNPLNPFFTNGQVGYFKPGLPVRPFGEFQGAAVSG